MKLDAQPLIRQKRTNTRHRLCSQNIQSANDSKRRESEITDADVLLDKVLEEFPLLDLDKHDRRILQQKAGMSGDRIIWNCIVYVCCYPQLNEVYFSDNNYYTYLLME